MSDQKDELLLSLLNEVGRHVHDTYYHTSTQEAGRYIGAFTIDSLRATLTEALNHLVDLDLLVTNTQDAEQIASALATCAAWRSTVSKVFGIEMSEEGRYSSTSILAGWRAQAHQAAVPDPGEHPGQEETDGGYPGYDGDEGD